MKKNIFPSNGHVFYGVTSSELSNILGLGICDECGTFAEQGYLIPILNHYQCPSCFINCHLHTCKKVYLDDLPIEKRYINFYEKHIPVTFDNSSLVELEPGIEYV